MASYLIEYIINNVTKQAGESAFFHVTVDPGPSAYLNEMTKERFLTDEGVEANTLAEELFEVPGVVSVSITAFRVLIVKEASFSWESGSVVGIISGVVSKLSAFLNTGLEEMPGSRRTVSASVRRSSMVLPPPPPPPPPASPPPASPPPSPFAMRAIKKSKKEKKRNGS